MILQKARKGTFAVGLLLAMQCLLWPLTAAARVIDNSTTIAYPVSSPYYPVLLTGDQIPSLLGVPVGMIDVFRVFEAKLERIPFQIDRRDQKGIFQIAVTDREKERELLSPLDENDELLFMAADMGTRLRTENIEFPRKSLIEVAFAEASGQTRGWVYIVIRLTPGHPQNGVDYVQYDPANDQVRALTYQMGFDGELPFLANSLRAKNPGDDDYGANFIDTMRLVHEGRFLHRFPFRRTEKDYTSRLVAVKDGRVRVIRRTVNRVHIMLGIGSPAVFVDYLHYPAGFVMDTIVDFPFKISFFFSDVSTTALLVLRENSPDHPLLVYSPSAPHGIPIGGSASLQEQKFNALYDSSMLLSGGFGQLTADIGMEQNSPIEVQTHIANDMDLGELSSNAGMKKSGLGFYMTKWEKLSTRTHHILFRAYLLNVGHSPLEGLDFLHNAPALFP